MAENCANTDDDSKVFEEFKKMIADAKLSQHMGKLLTQHYSDSCGLSLCGVKYRFRQNTARAISQGLRQQPRKRVCSAQAWLGAAAEGTGAVQQPRLVFGTNSDSDDVLVSR